MSIEKKRIYHEFNIKNINNDNNLKLFTKTIDILFLSYLNYIKEKAFLSKFYFFGSKAFNFISNSIESNKFSDFDIICNKYFLNNFLENICFLRNKVSFSLR